MLLCSMTEPYRTLYVLDQILSYDPRYFRSQFVVRRRSVLSLGAEHRVVHQVANVVYL